MSRSTIIIGAGISGLVLAHRLKARGRDVRLLEASSRPGGLIRSERQNGFLIEWGPNGFLDTGNVIRPLVRDLDLGDRLVEARSEAKRRYLLKDGRLVPVGGNPWPLIRHGLLSPLSVGRALLEPFVRPNPRGDESVHDFVARRLGAGIAALTDPVISGIAAGDATRLSMAATFPTVFDLEREHGSLFRGLLLSQRGERPALASFRDGMEELPRELARRLGPVLHLETRVRALQPEGDTVRVDLEAGPSLTADRVVCACPGPAAARLLEGFDRGLAGRLDGLTEPAPLVVVARGYAIDQVARPLDGFGFLVPRSEGLHHLGVLWSSSIYPERAPEGTVLLRSLLGGAHDPAFVKRDDRELSAIVDRELDDSIGVRGEPLHETILRHRPGLPQYPVGHRERIDRLRRDLNPLKIHLCGNGYDGLAVPRCVASALKIASQLG